jgi:hypothetical protein
MELWVIRHDWHDELEEWALTHFGVRRWPGRPSLKKLKVEIWSVLLIALGVAGELGVGIRIAVIDGHLRSLDIQLRAKNAELRTKSDQLVALMDARRAELQSRMLDIFGPRTMSSAQSEETIKKLRGLTGIQVDVFVVDFASAPTSKEFQDSVSMGRSIQNALHAANLDSEAWIVDSCGAETSATGLSVATHFGAATMDEYFAGKILAAFPTSLGFVNKLQNWEPKSYQCKFSNLPPVAKPNKREPGTAKIMVIIGTRTQPILTREMLEPNDDEKKPNP